MPQYKEEGIVLRTHKLGETDRIITLLGRNSGQIRAVAKGVRKTSSKFGARLEPFMAVEAQFYKGKTLDVVTQVETVASYGKQIVADYDSYLAGSQILETAERLTRETSSQQHFQLLMGAPGLVNKLKNSPSAQKQLTELRKKNLDRSKVSDEIRKRFIDDVYGDEIHQLSKLISRDLSHWMH